MRHVHLIGIGGSGLSAIARLLLERGVLVSGSDRQPSATTEALQAAGARVSIGHRAENIRGADVVVRSSAVPDGNVEVQAALDKGLPVLKRVEFLGRLVDGYQVIAVAGTHGKTTTTAMISAMLASLGQDPSFIIGGMSFDLSTNAHSSKGRLFVIEADEYDRMFLGLNPDLAVVTNIEHDHPDCYPTPEDFYLAFRDFANRVKPAGMLLVCLDDPGSRRLLEEVQATGKPVLSYGMNHWLDHEGPDYTGRSLEPNQVGGFSFEALRRSPQGLQSLSRITLQVPGRHNASNALAALAVADQLSLPPGEAARALSAYHGVGRRFEVRGEIDGITVIDDYAHHPSEIRATLAAARVHYPGRTIWAVWQPHTYSRSRALFNEFAASFGDADHVLVTEIYAARETPPADGFSSRQLVDAIQRVHAHVLPVAKPNQAVEMLLGSLRRGDVLLVLSAGDADQISGLLLKSLGRRDQSFVGPSGSRSE